MTCWERTGNTKYRDKITVGLEDIKKAPLQLISGSDFEFDPATCHLRYIGERTTGRQPLTGMHGRTAGMAGVSGFTGRRDLS